jgi:plastocyanin
VRRFSVVVLALALAASACSEGRTGPLVIEDPTAVEADYEYVIPAGTGARFDAGEVVEILPASLEVQVGEVLRIINEDDREHLVGPFYVGAGETLTQQFANAGDFTGVCTVHPSGQFILRVND